MAVNRVPGGSLLRMVLQTGTDAQGNPVYRNRSLRSVKPDAADQDLYDVAQVLAGLQEYPLNGVSRIDGGQLIEE